jgi:hypothetical protein
MNSVALFIFTLWKSPKNTLLVSGRKYFDLFSWELEIVGFVTL